MTTTFRRLAIPFIACLLLFPALAAAQEGYGPGQLTGDNPFSVPESGHDCTTNPDAVFANCSFETGDYTGWINNDMAAPFLPQQIAPGGSYLGYGFFATAPTQGTLSSVNGFDGGGPDVIELAQDIDVPSTGGTLEFDYRGAWDLQTFGGTIDRTFSVEVQPSGGGAAMQSDVILTAPAGTLVTDTGSLTGTADLGAFAGQSVRVAFVWDIPEPSVGPGFFEIDNVAFNAAAAPATEIPTQSTLGMLLLITALLGAAIFVMRRRG